MNHPRSTLAVKAATIAAVLTLTSAVHAATMINGSFENGSFSPDGNNIMSLQPGSTAITGWTTFNAETAWIRFDNPFISPASDGNFYLDLTGYHDSQPYGGVSQTITTVIGEQCSLSFDVGVSGPAYPGPVSVLVSAGAASTTVTYNPVGNGTKWGQFTFDFTATTTATPVSFVATASQSGYYVGLDKVAVSTVPEPEEYAAITGAALLGFMAWHRRGKR